MRIAVVADDAAKQEWSAAGIREGVEPEWIEAPAVIKGADGYIDLLFDRYPNRLEAWEAITDVPVIINDTLKENGVLPGNFIRINAWPTFSARPVAEAAYTTTSWKEPAEELLAAFQKKTEWVADIPGMVSARVVCMMINEAWYTLDEGVSTKEETDTAMKLGTNYPYGPFEWGNKIGLENVYRLLEKLSAENSRYTPCAALTNEVKNGR